MKADTLLRRLARALILPLLLPLTLAPPARAQAEPANTLALGPDGSANVLVVHASNSLPVFRGVLEDFHRIHPALRLEYTELPTQALYDEIIARRRDATSEKSGPDLVISSAMDLQTKLANDGYALPHDSPETRALPAWANWRDEVFSTGTDPIVMVYDTRRLDAARAPRTRRALLSLLQAPDRPLAGAVSTYDVGASAIGYLAATQDTRLDSMAPALLAALGQNDAALYASSDDALDMLERGDATLAYNVLESYTRHRIERGAPLAVIYPRDYTLMLSRAALIPRQAPRPDLGAMFLDYLLSPRGQHMIAQASGMRPVGDSVVPAAGVRPLGLGVGLLVYQDALKKRHFLTCGGRRSGPPTRAASPSVLSLGNARAEGTAHQAARPRRPLRRPARRTAPCRSASPAGCARPAPAGRTRRAADCRPPPACRRRRPAR